MIDGTIVRRYGKIRNLFEARQQFADLRTRFAFLLEDPLLAEKVEILSMCMAESDLDQNPARCLGYACQTLAKLADIIIWQLYLGVEELLEKDRLLCLTAQAVTSFEEVQDEAREYLKDAADMTCEFGASARLACAEKAMDIVSGFHSELMLYVANPRNMPQDTPFDRMLTEVREVPKVTTWVMLKPRGRALRARVRARSGIIYRHVVADALLQAPQVPEPPPLDEIARLFAGAKSMSYAYA